MKDYLYNFISDFLNINSLTLQIFFQRWLKKLAINLYNKSEKNRPQVVNQELTDVKKINYPFKGKQRSFYKKV